jgi:hypothetical protein
MTYHLCMRWRWFLLPVLVACGDGDGGSSGLDLEGKPGEEAARLVATQLCEREARCGRASVDCRGGGSAGGMTTGTQCTGQIAMVSATDCFDDVFGDLSEILSCKPITMAEAAIIRACFEPQIARACLTQADVDQAARMQESGQSSNLNPRPPACQQFFADFAGRCP